MAGAHIDTRYIQNDQQQFTTLLSQTEKHKIFLEFLQGVSLLHPFLCYT